MRVELNIVPSGDESLRHALLVECPLCQAAIGVKCPCSEGPQAKAHLDRYDLQDTFLMSFIPADMRAALGYFLDLGEFMGDYQTVKRLDREV